MGMETTHTETTDDPEAQAGKDHTTTGALVKYDERDREVIRRVIGRGQLSEVEVDFVQAQAERLGLDVMTKQMHVWKDRVGQIILMVGIDGLRLVARRTGKFRGRSDPEWLHHEHGWVDAWVYDGNPLAARVRVYHADYLDKPMTGLAVWAEAVQTRYDEKLNQRVPNSKWTQQPAHMLAKVAEAMALRAAFPAELAGVYTDDEISRADQMMQDTGDPETQPGADDPVVLALEERIAALPGEFRAKLEAWWGGQYSDRVLRSPVTALADGGLRRFTGDSEHIEYWTDMVGKAEAKLADLDETPVQDDTTQNEPQGDSWTDDGSPLPPNPEPASAPAGGDALERIEEDVTDLEAGVIDALDAMHHGKASEIAQMMGRPANDGQVRTTVAALFERDIIELDPDAEQGRGPHRVYRLNEDLLADINGQETTQ